MTYTLKAMLGMANDAPGDALVDTIDWAKWRNRALWAVGIVAIVVAVLWYFYKKDVQHEADKAAAVTKIETAPAPASKPFWKPKPATKQIAPKATNTPPMVEAEPLSQFELDVIAFETKVKKEFQ